MCSMRRFFSFSTACTRGQKRDEVLIACSFASLPPLIQSSLIGLDLLHDDVDVLALGDLLAGAGVDHLRAGDFVDLAHHLLEDRDGAEVHFLFVLVDVLLQRLLLLVAHVHATAEALGADDDAFLARRHFQRVVLHVFAGAAEDRVEEFLFRRELGLATSGRSCRRGCRPGRRACRCGRCRSHRGCRGRAR